MERLRLIALGPELDIASEGDAVEQARANLTEALEFFFEAASPGEIDHRLRRDIVVTNVVG